MPQSSLEVDVPLSESLAWQRQREYYARSALGAWSEDRVPNYITNNPFIAETHARIVCAFIRDCLHTHDYSRNGSSSPTFRIFEPGAGSGKFAYLFLKQLMAQLESEHLQDAHFRYCMTDCSPALLEWWNNNEYLSNFLATGHLTFELLNLGGEDQSEFLQRSTGPLIVIANYLFDSLPQDAFVAKDGRMFESLVTTSATGQSSDDTSLSNLERTFRNISVCDDRYAEPEWNNILKRYSETLSDATILFPVIALKLIRKLKGFSGGRMLVLAADKGFVHEQDLLACSGDPHFEFHQPDCFSQTVNFDAIARDCEAQNGIALLPDKHSSNLSMAAFIYGVPDSALTRQAYLENRAAFGVDDLFALMAWLRPHLDKASAAELLAILRLSRWDPIALIELFPLLTGQLTPATAQRHDLREALLRVWNNDYPICENDKKLAFNCGVILLQIGFFDEARAMFERSRELLGPSAATDNYLHLCSQNAAATKTVQDAAVQ